MWRGNGKEKKNVGKRISHGVVVGVKWKESAFARGESE